MLIDFADSVGTRRETLPASERTGSHNNIFLEYNIDNDSKQEAELAREKAANMERLAYVIMFGLLVRYNNIIITVLYVRFLKQLKSMDVDLTGKKKN